MSWRHWTGDTLEASDICLPAFYSVAASRRFESAALLLPDLLLTVAYDKSGLTQRVMQHYPSANSYAALVPQAEATVFVHAAPTTHEMGLSATVDIPGTCAEIPAVAAAVSDSWQRYGSLLLLWSAVYQSVSTRKTSR